MLLFLYGERQRHKIMPKNISCEGMDVSGDDPDSALTVLTCEGDIRDPTFPLRLNQIICKLKRLVSDDHKKPFQVTKVEPWNSVRVTFNIPRNAAQRLRQLAESGDITLRELGILSVQIEGDQVITLTLANNYNESHELLLGKANESVVNSASVVTSSALNSAININNSDIGLTYNHSRVNNSLISTSNSVVSSIVSSNLDLIGSPSSGPSVEITRKNIAQYLSQTHTDVVTPNSNSVLSSNDPNRDPSPAFRSPNVVAPANHEPLPFLSSSANSTLTSQSSISVPSMATTCIVSSSTGSRLANQVTSVANPLREVQSNYGLFPFASMQHAMHTKQGLNQTSHYASVQRPNQVITTPIRMPSTQTSLSLPNKPAITSPLSSITSVCSSSSLITSISKPLSTYTRDAKSMKLSQQSITSQSQKSAQLQSQPQQAQNMALAAVAAAANQSSQGSNGASANVALTSPLLVNLLQSDANSGHLKGVSQSSSLNPITISTELIQKRKPRKARKSKDKLEYEASESTLLSNSTPTTQTNITPPTSASITQTTSPSIKNLPSNPFPQQSGVDSTASVSTQSSYSLPQHLISIPINAMSRFPSIHPEAQGQPQVVRAGHLTLRSQLTRPQVSSTIVGSPAIATHLRKPLFVTTSQASCSKTISSSNAQIKPHNEGKSSLIASSNATNVNINSNNDKESATNVVFPSPPTSRVNCKTKHLINPFTGLLEPMLSDEEEDDRPSPTTLFPELDAGSDVGGNSERSLSDAGSNGKDNNHSSDTDSGLGKSGTDVSSQSSIDVGNGETLSHLKDISSNTCVPVSEGITSSDPTLDKLKVKVESKTQCPKTETTEPSITSSNPTHSKSHYTKQKSTEPLISCSVTNQCIENQVLVTEPRVPPLHISIRGPNSAVVVSNRRESTSDIETKTSVSKKIRAVRTTRAMSAESTLVTECTNNLNKNQRKKLQREQRFLSGGGIVTSNLSASPSVESLIDLNKTLNDSSFSLSSTKSSDSVDSLLQSSEVSSHCAQNLLNNNDNNISINKSVPQVNNDDNNSEKCAIHLTSNSVNNTNVISMPSSDNIPVISNSLPSEGVDSHNNKAETDKESKPSSPSNQKLSNVQTCHSSLTVSPDHTNSCSAVTLPSTHSDTTLFKDNNSLIENFKTKHRKLPVAAVVTVEPLINAKTDNMVNKISRRTNCVTTAIPALVNTRELNSVRTANSFCLIDPSSPDFDSFNENAIESECDDVIELSDIKSTSNCALNTSESITNSVTEVVSMSESNSVKSHSQSTNNLMNGEMKSEISICSTNFNDHSESSGTNFDSNVQELKDSCKKTVKNLVNEETNVDKNTKKELNKLSDKIEIKNEIKSENVNIKCENQTVCKINELPISSSVLSTTETAVTSISITTEKINIKNKPIVDKIDQNSSSSKERSEVNEKTNELMKNDIKFDIKQSTITEIRATQTPPTVITNSIRSDETKQPLQIVITTTVPSFTTSTTSSVFSQLKSSSLESGSRVTLITFKPNLNSPNTSSSNSGKNCDLSNSSLTNAMPPKTVPFKLLTIPSGSGGITVRSAANKLVELINSTASSPVSPLSPNNLPSSGSPLPINSTSPPVRLLVSKVATAGSVTQTGVSVSGNSIGQLVVVKSVVVTNPSPSIKLVPAKSPSINSPSLLIPVTRTHSPECNNNSVNNEIKTYETKTQLLNNNESKNNSTSDESSNSGSDLQNQDSNSTDIDLPQLEPVDLTVQCQDSSSLTSNDETKLADDITGEVPKLIRSSIDDENDMNSDEDIIDDKLHSVASDHNYILKKSSDVEEDDETSLNLSISNDNMDLSKDNDIHNEDEYNSIKVNDINSDNSSQSTNQSQDIQSRPNKRKSSENAAELIKACMGVEDQPKRNSTHNCSQSYPISTGVTQLHNISTRTRASSLDNDFVTTSEPSEVNCSNKSKNLRNRKSKVSSDSPYVSETVCSSDGVIEIKDTTISWANKPKLRATAVTKNQKINKQKAVNNNKDIITNRINEKGKKGRDRDQTNKTSTQRSTRRSRDQNIMINTGGINLHANDSTSEPLHMEIVGLEISNDSNTNNYSIDPSTASTTAQPIIRSSLLVKRKTRIGLNSSDQTEGVVTKRRRIVKETHR